MLPGQPLMLHCADLNALQGLFRQFLGVHVAPLGQLHTFPTPYQVHMLLLVFTPPPQVLEHLLNFDQRLHIPLSTTRI